MEAFVYPIVCSVILFILGFAAGRLSKAFKKVGRFVINEGDPLKSAFWLELDYDLDVLERQDYIGFKVQYHRPPENDDAAK